MTAKRHHGVTILFLDILTDDKKLRKIIDAKVYGGKSYSEDMRETFGLRKDEWVWIDASKGKFPKSLSGFDAIVIGGSTEDPVKGKEKAWMEKTYPFIRRVIKNEMPLLGICGGLQFVVRALGGNVTLNPKGREFGNTDIALTKAGRSDRIFKGLPDRFMVQSSHKYRAEKLGIGWKLLGSSPACRFQAIAIGDHIRLVQFHPEMKKRQIKEIAKLREKAFIEEGLVKNAKEFGAFLVSFKDTSRVGRKICKNFLTSYVFSAR